MSRGKSRDTLHATARGTVAAMGMSGMRTLTKGLGLVEETPPEMVTDETVPHALRRMPRSKQVALVTLAHWAYGAAGGAAFGLLPPRIRLKPWAGPLYGLVHWVFFEALLAPALGLYRRRHRPLRERAALAADHLLYGWVLSELRSRPRR